MNTEKNVIGVNPDVVLRKWSHLGFFDGCIFSKKKTSNGFELCKTGTQITQCDRKILVDYESKAKNKSNVYRRFESVHFKLTRIKGQVLSLSSSIFF